MVVTMQGNQEKIQIKSLKITELTSINKKNQMKTWIHVSGKKT